MTNKYLLFYGLLSLSLAGVSGCAQQMAKQDSITHPSSAQPSRQNGDGQAKAAAPETTAAQNKAPATPAAAAGSAPMPASNAASGQPAPKTDKKVPAAEETAAAATLLPLPPQEIVDTIKTLTRLHRVRYLSRTAQYDFYVGGKMDAKYDINKSQLLVTNAPAKDKNTVTCDYSKNGDMISDKKAIPTQKVEECNKLVNELTAYMQR
jgi:hypothetical protein